MLFGDNSPLHYLPIWDLSDLPTLSTYQHCNLATLFANFPWFWHPKRDTRVTRLATKTYPFYALFFSREWCTGRNGSDPPTSGTENTTGLVYVMQECDRDHDYVYHDINTIIPNCSGQSVKGGWGNWARSGGGKRRECPLKIFNIGQNIQTVYYAIPEYSSPYFFFTHCL